MQPVAILTELSRLLLIALGRDFNVDIGRATLGLDFDVNFEGLH
jgi:hypothetical protein